jgi:hypothetical protein
MKLIKIILPLCALIVFVGCEKRLFHFVATITQSPNFPINTIGDLRLPPIPVFSAAFHDAFDIPAGGRITRVDIESFTLRAVEKAGNQATALRVTGVIIEDGGVQQTILFEQDTIVVGAADAPLSSLKTLNDAGIENLRRKIEGYVTNTDTQTFALQLSGEILPAGRRLVIDLQLVLKATAKYDQCLEAPGLFSEGEKCRE